jgi:hypothetical protein
MKTSNCSSSWKTWVRRTLNVSVSVTITVPALVVALSAVPVLVVVSDTLVPVVVVPVCVNEVELPTTDEDAPVE